MRKKILFLFITLCFLNNCLDFSSSGSRAVAQRVPYGKDKKYKETKYPTPNIAPDRKNDVRGVILHHTAEPTVENSLAVLTSLKKKVGTHVVIDTDGTRYVMAEPTVVTFHAGYSLLDGRENCNNFTIGIEFQGNTLEKPLTDDQINSAIEYLLPLISKYNIPINNIVTHEMVRNAYMKKHPEKRCWGKVDITQVEYERFMIAIKDRLKRTPTKAMPVIPSIIVKGNANTIMRNNVLKK